MGSFDVTCSISGLPILKGDNVKHVLLMQDFSNRSLHTKICSVPLSGKYDDYGKVIYDKSNPKLSYELWELYLNKCDISKQKIHSFDNINISKKDLSLLLYLIQKNDFILLENNAAIFDGFIKSEVWDSFLEKFHDKFNDYLLISDHADFSFVIEHLTNIASNISFSDTFIPDLCFWKYVSTKITKLLLQSFYFSIQVNYRMLSFMPKYTNQIDDIRFNYKLETLNLFQKILKNDIKKFKKRFK